MSRSHGAIKQGKCLMKILAGAVVALLSFFAVSAPAVAQVSATLPVTCTPSNICTRATAVANPDGTNVGVGNAAAPSVVKEQGGASIATGQVSVGTTATQVVAATQRTSVDITVDSAVKCYLGPAGVTTATGFPLQAVAGASKTVPSSAAVYAVCASTVTIGYMQHL